MFVLAHLSDIHLPPLPVPRPSELFSKRGLGYINWLRKRHQLHQRDILDGLMADLKTQHTDHIAITGDLVNLSLSTEFGPAQQWIEAVGEPDGVTFVPGNHDWYVEEAEGQCARHWGGYMRGDEGPAGFPFVRRRGPVALIGVSTSLPTLPLSAAGSMGRKQREQFSEILRQLGEEKLFRVVLIHHPPISESNQFRKLTDGRAVREILRKHGAELVLHGHHHESSLVWLAGPRFAIPCVGVPTASGARGHNDEPGAYNLYEIDGEAGAWRCTMTSRGYSNEADGILMLNRSELADVG